MQWALVKQNCPLCKMHFKSLIHNVKSIHEYDQVWPPQAEDTVILQIFGVVLFSVFSVVNGFTEIKDT